MPPRRVTDSEQIKSLNLRSAAHHIIDTLDGKNYPLWKDQVKMSFTARGIMQYLTKTSDEIQNFSHQDQAEAYMSLMSTLNQQIRCSHSKIQNPKELWENLKTTYEQSNIEIFISLCADYKKLILEENTTNIDEFIMKLQSIFSNLENMEQHLSNDFQIALMC